MAGAGRFFQERTTITIRPKPRIRATGGMIGGAVETFHGRRGQNRGSIFLHEALLDQAVTVSARDCGHEFVAHAVGSRAADVVAFQENLFAAADAHHLVTDFVEAGGGISGSEKSEDGEAEQ